MNVFIELTMPKANPLAELAWDYQSLAHRLNYNGSIVLDSEEDKGTKKRLFCQKVN